MRHTNAERPIERCVITNRIFLLGLDELYRTAVMEYERWELLTCARRVAEALGIEAADVPVEGYYAREPLLSRYFSLMRVLQNVGEDRIPEVAALPEFRRLREVTGSPIYGDPVQGGKLLPVGRDALSRALYATRPDWTVTGLTATAYGMARDTSDISLVGLAALAREPVVLTALRESVVLYGEMVFLGMSEAPPRVVYVWEVDDELAERAGRFVDTFNALFGEDLPAPVPENADRYWQEDVEYLILGRCVRLGYDDRVSPMSYYHWAICRGPNRELTVQEFWDTEVWTTERYKARLRIEIGGPCPDLGK